MKNKLKQNVAISSLIIITTFLFITIPYSLHNNQNLNIHTFNPTIDIAQNAITTPRSVRRPYHRLNPPLTRPTSTPIISPEQVPEIEISPVPTVPTTTPISDVKSSPVDKVKTMAWIYPGAPACEANIEYADGRNIDVLKAEFFTITNGTLNILTSDCNSYSTLNIALLKKSSTEQFVTISSSDADSMETFLARAITEPNTDVNTLVDFVTKNNLSGIELDFEGFSNWSATAYRDYKSFVSILGTALHKNHKKLMIDGPAVSNATEEANWYLWRYADFTSLPVDSVVVMAYDYQYDYAGGTPIAPLNWLSNVTKYISSKYPLEKLTIGLPSYGYQATSGQYDIKILTGEQISKLPGYATAKRDSSSGEMTWKYGNVVYFFQDATSLQMKRAVVEKLGINSISIWHLGGNPWF